MLEDDDEAAKMFVLDDEPQHQQQLQLQLQKEQSNANSVSGSDTAEVRMLRLTVVSIGLTLVSIGILANLLFATLAITRNRLGRSRVRPLVNLTRLLMLSMCTASTLNLFFYSLKLCVYTSRGHMLKFDVLDPVYPWPFGDTLCRLVSTMPIFGKIVVRLSLLAVVVARLLVLLGIGCHQDDHDDADDNDDHDCDINRHGMRRSLSATLRNKLRTLVVRLFELPAVSVLVLAIWSVSLASAWPLFNMFKLKQDADGVGVGVGFCASPYDLTDDAPVLAHIYGSYLVYGLVVPCSLVLLLLLLIALVARCSMPATAPSTQPAQPTRPIATVTSDSSSIDDAFVDQSTSATATNTSHDEPPSPRPAVASSPLSGGGRRRSANGGGGGGGGYGSLLLWLVFVVHVSTSLAPEMARHTELSMDFANGGSNVDDYMSVLMRDTLTQARSYYAMQLVYVSEFALMPLIFLTFFLCTNSRLATATATANSSSDQEDLTLAEDVNNFKTKMKTKKPKQRSGLTRLLLQRVVVCFYDADLANASGRRCSSSSSSSSGKQRSKPSRLDTNTKSSSTGVASLNEANRKAPVKATTTRSSKREPIVNNQHQQQQQSGQRRSSKSSSLQSSAITFDMSNGGASVSSVGYGGSEQQSLISSSGPAAAAAAAGGGETGGNLLHVFQNPSWRINIRKQHQQPSPSQQTPTLTNNSSSSNSHMLINNVESRAFGSSSRTTMANGSRADGFFNNNNNNDDDVSSTLSQHMAAYMNSRQQQQQHHHLTSTNLL